MAVEIIARRQLNYITGYTKACIEPGCEEIWYCTKAAMHQIKDESWGNQRCRRHAAIQAHRRVKAMA